MSNHQRYSYLIYIAIVTETFGFIGAVCFTHISVILRVCDLLCPEHCLTLSLHPPSQKDELKQLAADGHG